MNVRIEPIKPDDREWVSGIVRGWGADFVISRGRKIYAAELNGFVAHSDSGDRVGLVTYEMEGAECEIVTLNAFTQFSGVGTRLVQAVRDMLKGTSVNRLWLITTNDNVDAIRFYHRRGFVIAAIHVDSIKKSRELKPSIPLIGYYGIPIRDEIEFEMMLG